MLSLIVCSRYQHITADLEKNIADTIGNTPYEIVWIDNSRGEYSIFQAYNIGVERAHYPYLCFMHEDIIYHSQDWGEKVIAHLNDRNIGFVGLAGAYYVDRISITWSRSRLEYVCSNFLQGKYRYGKYTTEQITLPTENGGNPIVTLLDGFWMSCRAELFGEALHWDEETFSGFHQYDSDISMQALKAGYWNKVAFDISIEHKSEGNFDNQFYDAVILFHKKWDNMLPILAPGFTLPEDYSEIHDIIRTSGKNEANLRQIERHPWQFLKSILTAYLSEQCLARTLIGLILQPISLIRSSLRLLKGEYKISYCYLPDTSSISTEETCANYKQFYDEHKKQSDWIICIHSKELLNSEEISDIEHCLHKKSNLFYQIIHLGKSMSSKTSDYHTQITCIRGKLRFVWFINSGKCVAPFYRHLCKK